MWKNGRIGLLLLVAVALAGCGPKNVTDPVYFAHLSPRSGPDKIVGEHAEHGIRLAVEEANQAADQVAGHRVAVLHGDTRGDPEVAQSEAVRLVTINRVAGLLGGTSAAEAEPLARIAQQYTLPLVTPAGLPKRLITPYVFSLGMSPVEQGKALARFVGEEPLQARRVAVLTNSREAISVGVAAAFVEEFRKGKEHSATEWTYQEEKEAPASARSVVRDKPGAVLLAATARDTPQLIRELRKAGLDAKVPVLFAGPEATGQSGSMLPLPLDADFEGAAYVATLFSAGAKTARLDAFAQKYQEKFGSAPDVHAVQAYDAARFLFEGCRQAKSFQGAKTRDELAKLTLFESLTGPLTFDGDQAPRRTIYVVRITGGKQELVRSYEPAAN